MRPHSITSFETKKIVPFPVLKHRRPANKVAKVEECILHCYCRIPDEMVCCYLRDACNGITKLVLMIRIVRMVRGYAHCSRNSLVQ